MTTSPSTSPIPSAPASTAWPAAAGEAAVVAGRTVLVAGATGLVGREILRALSTDESVLAVHCVGRRAVAASHPKIVSHVVDLTAPGTLPAVDEVYIALGTTIKVAGSQDAFYKVDHDAVLGVARAAYAAGARKMGVVSAMGADPKSSLFYSRVKGETEADLRAIGYTTLVIAQPSFLWGDRETLGQPLRGGEKLALNLSKWLRFLIPANYRTIAVSKVAAALLSAVPAGVPGVKVMLSGEMQRG